jgi:hypothetical protein
LVAYYVDRPERAACFEHRHGEAKEVTKHLNVAQSPLKNIKYFNPIVFLEWTGIQSMPPPVR